MVHRGFLHGKSLFAAFPNAMVELTRLIFWHSRREQGNAVKLMQAYHLVANEAPPGWEQGCTQGLNKTMSFYQIQAICLGEACEALHQERE